MKKPREQAIVSVTSLDELHSMAMTYYENPEEGQKALDIYAEDLLKHKVDNVAYFIGKEKFAIEYAKEYIRALSKELKKQINAFEKIKSYFRDRLRVWGYDKDNKLEGISRKIWFKDNLKVRDVLKWTDVPEEFVNVDVKIPLTDFKRLLGDTPNVWKTSYSIDKIQLKEAWKKGLIKEDVMEISYHFASDREVLPEIVVVDSDQQETKELGYAELIEE